MSLYGHIRNVLGGILLKIDKKVNDFGAQYVAFGIFGVINYPVSHFWLQEVTTQEYRSLTLRLIAAFLCIPLILKNHWPLKLRAYLPLYWYITLLYCLPFFGAFMLFKNHMSMSWLMNNVIGMFLFILLVDWLGFVVLLGLGMGLGWLCFWFTSSNELAYIDHTGVSLAIYLYVFSIVIGAIFSRSKEKLYLGRVEAMTTIGSSIAHELRTPLASIDGGIAGAKRYLPKFIEGYNLAKQANLPVPKIRSHHYESLLTLLDDISAETHYANTIIDMLLVKANQKQINYIDNEINQIVDCIDEALRRYPFYPSEQASLIHWDMSSGFSFKGKQLLIIHILFNLLKNALYFIADAQKGEIFIRTEQGKKYNKLYFKDTAKGIPDHIKQRLFEKFYSNTRNGTGLGLAFCKMVMVGLGGKIECHSKEGEYTEFILSFPKLENKN